MPLSNFKKVVIILTYFLFMKSNQATSSNIICQINQIGNTECKTTSENNKICLDIFEHQFQDYTFTFCLIKVSTQSHLLKIQIFDDLTFTFYDITITQEHIQSKPELIFLYENVKDLYETMKNNKNRISISKLDDSVRMHYYEVLLNNKTKNLYFNSKQKETDRIGLIIQRLRSSERQNRRLHDQNQKLKGSLSNYIKQSEKRVITEEQLINYSWLLYNNQHYYQQIFFLKDGTIKFKNNDHNEWCQRRWTYTKINELIPEIHLTKNNKQICIQFLHIYKDSSNNWIMQGAIHNTDQRYLKQGYRRS